jgi:branched-chain amino acid transport system substrate-binding protein
MIRMTRTRGNRFAVAFAMLALIIASACGGSGSSGSGGASKAPFALYFVSDLTGTTASIGQPLSVGVKAYIDWTNKEGGVNGHKLSLTTLDDGQDVQKVKLDVQQASTAGALAILGANTSNGWSPNAPFITQTQIPTVGLGFTDPQLDPNTPYLYGLIPSYLQMSTMDFNFLQDQLITPGTVPAKPKIAFWHYTSTAVSTMVTYYKQIVQAKGFTLTTEQSFAQNVTDVSSQATALAQTKPDAVIANLIDAIAPLTVKALREKGYAGPIINFTGASSTSTFQALKDPLYYSLRAVFSTNDTDQPGISTIVSRAKAVGDTQGMDNNYFNLGWMTGAITVAALKKCGDGCTAAKMNTAYENVGKVDANGLNPDIQYSPTRHRAVTSGIYFHWDSVKGKEVPVGGFMQGS